MNIDLEKRLRDALGDVFDPYTGEAFTTGLTLTVADKEKKRRIEVSKGYPLGSSDLLWRDDLVKRIAGVLELPESAIGLDQSESHLESKVQETCIALNTKVAKHAILKGTRRVEGVKNIIAVASGKGGVGKSTVATNIAMGLVTTGAAVGILDADIYGPSQPKMLACSGKPEQLDDKRMKPMLSQGIKLMSIGFMVDEDTPMIWRGPMVTQALEQLLRTTSWNFDGNDLDYLIVDLPPGTGDIQLTLSQRVPVTGAVIVTTPQDIALLDARKAYKMFEKVSIPVLGLVENMSTHICSACGHEEAIFGTGGAQKMVEDFDLDLLGSIPLDVDIRQHSDIGTPSVIATKNDTIRHLFQTVALKVAARQSLCKKDFSGHFSSVVVEES